MSVRLFIVPWFWPLGYQICRSEKATKKFVKWRSTTNKRKIGISSSRNQHRIDARYLYIIIDRNLYIYIYWIDNSNLYFRFILGFLRVLHKQIGHLEVVNLTTLKAKWRGVCLSLKHLEEILQSGANNQLSCY